MEQIPPHSEEAEKAVLGSLLVDPDALAKVASFLKPRDFFHKTHEHIYSAILSLHQDRIAVDLVTLMQYLEDRKLLRIVGGAIYLSQLAKEVHSASHINHYAELVKEKSRRRQAQLLVRNLDHNLSDANKNTKDIVREVVTHLTHIVEDKKTNDGKIDCLLSQVLTDWEVISKNKQVGLQTGIDAFDSAIKGYREGHYWLVMADTNIGKTSFSVMMIDEFYKKNPKSCVVFFSGEMTCTEMAEKLVAKASDLDVYDLPTKQGDERVVKAVTDVENRDIFIYDDCRTTEQMGLKIEYLKLRGYKPDMVFIDYIQQVGGPGKGVERLERISRDLQAMAIRQKFCLVVLSQIPKSERELSPYNVHPKGSADIKNHAGVALYIQRDIPQEEVNQQQHNESVHEATVTMTKNRYGERHHFTAFINTERGHYYPRRPQYVTVAGSLEKTAVYPKEELNL